MELVGDVTFFLKVLTFGSLNFGGFKKKKYQICENEKIEKLLIEN